MASRWHLAATVSLNLAGLLLAYVSLFYLHGTSHASSSWTILALCVGVQHSMSQHSCLLSPFFLSLSLSVSVSDNETIYVSGSRITFAGFLIEVKGNCDPAYKAQIL